MSDDIWYIVSVSFLWKSRWDVWQFSLAGCRRLLSRSDRTQQRTLDISRPNVEWQLASLGQDCHKSQRLLPCNASHRDWGCNRVKFFVSLKVLNQVLGCSEGGFLFKWPEWYQRIETERGKLIEHWGVYCGVWAQTYLPTFLTNLLCAV